MNTKTSSMIFLVVVACSAFTGAHAAAAHTGTTAGHYPRGYGPSPGYLRLLDQVGESCDPMALSFGQPGCSVGTYCGKCYTGVCRMDAGDGKYRCALNAENAIDLPAVPAVFGSKPASCSAHGTTSNGNNSNQQPTNVTARVETKTATWVYVVCFGGGGLLVVALAFAFVQINRLNQKLAVQTQQQEAEPKASVDLEAVV